MNRFYQNKTLDYQQRFRRYQNMLKGTLGEDERNDIKLGLPLFFTELDRLMSYTIINLVALSQLAAVYDPCCTMPSQHIAARFPIEKQPWHQARNLKILIQHTQVRQHTAPRVHLVVTAFPLRPDAVLFVFSRNYMPSISKTTIFSARQSSYARRAHGRLRPLMELRSDALFRSVFLPFLPLFHRRFRFVPSSFSPLPAILVHLSCFIALTHGALLREYR